IFALNPDVVGITSTTVGITVAGLLAERIKASKPETIIVVGGCHASAIPIETLNEFKAFDILVLGEGENTLLDILKSVEEQKSVPHNICGTAHRTGSTMAINPSRPLIQNLDDLPLPAWSLLYGFPKMFRPSPARIRQWPCASVVLTRGCPNSCTFCDRSVFGNRCRSYSPSYAVNLLKDLRNNFGVKEILIEDDTFIMSPKWVNEFCSRLITDKLNISWSCLGRADRMTSDMAKIMHKAGCWHISFGIESGDEKLLKTTNKKLDIKQIRSAVDFCKAAGLKTKGFFMIGFPGETEQSISLTRNLAISLPLDDISIMQLTPFPGTEMYSTAHLHGQFERDWRKMNTLNTVFIPDGFSRYDMEQARSTILQDFYFRPRIILSHIVNMLRHPHLIFPMLRSLFTLFRVLFRKNNA
ncbi:MAG: radical SAM protein, partial [Kiritimatiellae bacterium]|nr:radical SAM protein [Kiritimatiellia bacterium]